MKKSIKLILCLILLVFILTVNSYATVYNYDSFIDGDGYGTKEKINDNVTRMKGGTDDGDGMLEGPYSKSSTATLQEGIKEETHVKVDLEKMKDNELFQVSLAVNLKEGETNDYANEEVVTIQKSGDVAYVTASGRSNYIAVIGETGIYTFRWEINKEDDGVKIKVSVYNYETLIGTTGEMDFDSIRGPVFKELKDKNPSDVSVRYLWFNNIKVEEGIDVYATLPSRESADPQPQPQPSTEPTTQPAPADEPVKDVTPKTGSQYIIQYIIGIVLVSAVGIIVLNKKK